MFGDSFCPAAPVSLDKNKIKHINKMKKVTTTGHFEREGDKKKRIMTMMSKL